MKAKQKVSLQLLLKNMRRFNKIFSEELIKEIPVIDIGILPGKFKPPHKGHFKTAKVANDNNKIVFILISSKEHEGVSANISFDIWSIYKKYLPNIELFVVEGAPVGATYELLNLLNNGGQYYTPTNTSAAPKTNILELVQQSDMLQTYLNKGNNFVANLYSSPEDQRNYKSAKQEPFSGRNITKINFQPVDRSTSATLFRGALKTQNNLTIEAYLPKELSPEDKKAVISILRKNVNV
jgi:hypothetical protein